MLSIAWLLASRSCSSTITTRSPCMPRWNNYAPAKSHGNMKCKVRTSSGLRFPGLRSRQRLNRKPCSPVVVIDCGLTEMKLRLQGNSLRLRLTRSEVVRLDGHGTVEEAASFGSGGRLTYRIQSRTGTEPLHADFSGGAITVLLYTSDAADDLTRVDLGGRRIIKKKKKQ